MPYMVNCACCSRRVDTDDCTRTFIGHNWHFFCRKCENDGSARIYVRKALKDEKQKSGA